LERPLEAVAVHDGEAAEVLLGLDVGAVAHDRRALLAVHRLGLGLVGDAPGADQLARLVERLVQGVGLRDDPGDPLLGERLPEPPCGRCPVLASDWSATPQAPPSSPDSWSSLFRASVSATTRANSSSGNDSQSSWLP